MVSNALIDKVYAAVRWHSNATWEDVAEILTLAEEEGE